MRDSARLVLAGLAAVSLVSGTALLLSAPRADEQPIVLNADTVFPDYSTGNAPGTNVSNQVGIRVSLATMVPWIQGKRHLIVATIDAEPGKGVTSVDFTTLILYLERPASPRREILNSDLVLLEPAGTNRWVSMDGALLIFPNGDVFGTNYFLSVALSLNVNYTNGRSYGWGGWESGVRIVSPEIVPDPTPVSLLLLAAGMTGLVLVAISWISARRGTQLPR